MARSLEGWLVPQQGLKSSRFPSWRSDLDGRQSLCRLSPFYPSLAGPLLIPATEDPASLQRRTWTCLQAAVPRPAWGGPCLSPPSAANLHLPWGCSCPAKHLASFGRSHGSGELRGGCRLASFLTSEHTVQRWGTVACPAQAEGL